MDIVYRVCGSMDLKTFLARSCVVGGVSFMDKVHQPKGRADEVLAPEMVAALVPEMVAALVLELLCMLCVRVRRSNSKFCQGV